MRFYGVRTVGDRVPGTYKLVIEYLTRRPPTVSTSPKRQQTCITLWLSNKMIIKLQMSTLTPTDPGKWTEIRQRSSDRNSRRELIRLVIGSGREIGRLKGGTSELGSMWISRAPA